MPQNLPKISAAREAVEEMEEVRAHQNGSTGNIPKYKAEVGAAAALAEMSVTDPIVT